MRWWVKDRKRGVDSVAREVTHLSATVSSHADAVRSKTRRLDEAAQRLMDQNDEQLRGHDE